MAESVSAVIRSAPNIDQENWPRKLEIYSFSKPPRGHQLQKSTGPALRFNFQMLNLDQRLSDLKIAAAFTPVCAITADGGQDSTLFPAIATLSVDGGNTCRKNLCVAASFNGRTS